MALHALEGERNIPYLASVLFLLHEKIDRPDVVARHPCSNSPFGKTFEGEARVTGLAGDATEFFESFDGAFVLAFAALGKTTQHQLLTQCLRALPPSGCDLAVPILFGGRRAPRLPMASFGYS
jgi:hypothetical protein